MKVQVNGVWQQTGAATLEELLVELDCNGQEVATAVDGAFVPRDGRAMTLLEEGAVLDIVAPVQGG